MQYLPNKTLSLGLLSIFAAFNSPQSNHSRAFKFEVRKTQAAQNERDA